MQLHSPGNVFKCTFRDVHCQYPPLSGDSACWIAQKKHTPLLCSISSSVPKPSIAARPLVTSARGLNHPACA